jgi:hypothetical protein
MARALLPGAKESDAEYTDSGVVSIAAAALRVSLRIATGSAAVSIGSVVVSLSCTAEFSGDKECGITSDAGGESKGGAVRIRNFSINVSYASEAVLVVPVLGGMIGGNIWRDLSFCTGLCAVTAFEGVLHRPTHDAAIVSSQEGPVPILRFWRNDARDIM